MAFDPKRIDRLAAKATLLEDQVRALVSELEELAELARAEARPEPILAHDPKPTPAPEPVAEAEPEPEDVLDPELVAEAEPASVPDPEPEPEPKRPASIPEGARLVALNMALSGKPRDETARYLRENYDLTDPDPLLDDVYAKAGS